MERKKVIVIVGPTCSGKTRLSIELAKKLGAEIISADSRQIYRYLTIGTAKPAKSELEAVRHHFIDEIDPDEEFNASMFEKSALERISALHRKNKIPIVAGGSGLYIKALIDGISEEALSDLDYRKLLMELREERGGEFLYSELQKVDPVSAGKMLPQNWKRVIRCLEVFHAAGKPIWRIHQEHKREIEFDFIQFGLNWDRDILYKNIEDRVDRMIGDGLVAEIISVLHLGYDAALNSLNTVGYKEIIEYLKGNLTFERAVELIKRNTRRYAKRQMTWFRKDERIIWFDLESADDISAAALKIFNKIIN